MEDMNIVMIMLGFVFLLLAISKWSSEMKDKNIDGVSVFNHYKLLSTLGPNYSRILEWALGESWKEKTLGDLIVEVNDKLGYELLHPADSFEQSMNKLKGAFNEYYGLR